MFKVFKNGLLNLINQSKRKHFFYIFSLIILALFSSFHINVDSAWIHALSLHPNNFTNFFGIYDFWSLGPFYYGYPPLEATFTILTSPIQFLFGNSWGPHVFDESINGYYYLYLKNGTIFNNNSLFIYGFLTKVSFFVYAFNKISSLLDEKSYFIWLLNPAIILIGASMKFNDAMCASILLISLFYLYSNQERKFYFFLFIAFFLKTTSLLIFIPLLLLIFNKNKLDFIILVLIYSIVKFSLEFPFNLHSDTYSLMNSLNFWQREGIHYGFKVLQRFGGMEIGWTFTTFSYCILSLYIIIKKIEFDLKNFIFFSLVYLIIYYLGAGAPWNRWGIIILPFFIFFNIIFDYRNKNFLLILWSFDLVISNYLYLHLHKGYISGSELYTNYIFYTYPFNFDFDYIYRENFTPMRVFELYDQFHNALNLFIVVNCFFIHKNNKKLKIIRDIKPYLNKNFVLITYLSCFIIFSVLTKFYAEKYFEPF